jgi:hypothetical protein
LASLLQNRNILLVSPEAWGRNFVSKHHYAIELAKKGNKVFFLNPTNKNVYRFKPVVRNIKEYATLYIVNYKPILRGLRFLPLAVYVFIEKIQIQILEKACCARFDIVWNFENSRFFNFKPWGKDVLKILHLVDLNQNFNTESAALTADICFCTTDYIQDKLKVLNGRVYKIHHGFAPTLEKSQNIELAGTNKIKALYVGNLHIPYIDWEVLAGVIEENSTVDFCFIGPTNKSNIGNVLSFETQEWLTKLKKYNNVYFLGEKAASEIQSYLVKADVLLLVYKAELYKEQLASPHKIMEYLGSGKVVVASYTDEYKGHTDLLLMASKKNDVPKLFKEAVQNLSFYNSPQLHNSRKAFALKNTYSKQLQKIEQILINEKLIGPEKRQ